MISAMPALPLSVGANRVVKGSRIEHVCGNPALPPDKDRAVGRQIVWTALAALQTEVTGPTLFDARVS
jgi:glycine reductase